MKTRYLTAAFLLLALTAKAQTTDFQSPASSGMGLSGAGDTTAWSTFTNPAGFADPVNPVAGMGYHNAFGLKDLSSKSAFVCLPTSLVTASASYVYKGNRLFSIQRFSAGASRKMSPTLHLGARFVYLLREINATESDRTFLMDAGMRFSPSSEFMIGIQALNPGRAKMVSHGTETLLPSSLSMTLSYQISSNINLAADLMHQAQGPTQHYGLALEARVHPRVILRGALSGTPVRLAIGSGLMWQHFQFDLSVNHHDPLGFSSSAGIFYTFPEKR